MKIRIDSAWSLKITITEYLRIQKKIDTKASIYVMFKDCARLKRNVFVTWKEEDVNEQNVDERKECWEREKSIKSYLS